MFTTQFFLSVLGATVAGYAVGAIWYSPLLFMNAYLKVLGKDTTDHEANKKEFARVMIYGFLNTGATAFALAVILMLLSPSTFLGYFYIVLFICFSFVVTTKFSDLIYASAGHHWERSAQILFLINSGYYIFSFGAMTVAFWFLR
ncbi:MAG: DUF1761 domain-containing protein [bacterium]|nr:DUF1761 domain-containing protein [bacterium]